MEQKKVWYIGLGIAFLAYVLVIFIAKFLGNIGIGVMIGPVIGFVIGILVTKWSRSKQNENI